MSNENPFLKGPRVQGGNPFLNGPRIPRPSPLAALGSPEYQARAQNLTRSRSHDAVTRVGDSIDPRVDYSQIPTNPRGMYGSVMGAKSGDIARTHDEFASDNRASLKQSALNVVGALPSMAAGLLSVPANYVNGLMQAQYAAQGTSDGWLLPTVSAEQIESAIGLPGFGKAMSEGVRASQAGQSDKLAAQRAEFDATDGAISAAHYLLSNPSFGLSLALEQAGQFATLATPGGATAKVLGGAVLAGGMNANEVQQDLAGRVQRGEITAAEASRRASNAFGLSAAANTLIPKALGSNAMTLERIASGAARSAAASAGSTAVLRGAGRGFLGEGLQGGLSEVADGAVKNHYTDKPLLADAGKNFVLGFGLEAMPGAAGGAVETLQAGPPESAKPSDTLRNELLTLGEELAGRDVVREEIRHVPSMPQPVQKDPGIVPEDASDIDALLMRNLPQRGRAKLAANPMPQGLGDQLAAGTVFDAAPPVLDATRIGDALAGVDFAQQAPKLDAALLGEMLAGDVLSRQPESNPETPVAAGSLLTGQVKTEAPQGFRGEALVKHSQMGQSDERPVTMQNRDRSRAASVAQMQSIEPSQAVPNDVELEATDGQAEVGSFGPIFRQFRHDAQGAIEHLAQQRTGEAEAALHHPEVGDIDLVWGKEGDAAKNYENGFGLAKIAKKHPEVLSDLQGFIESLSKDSGRSGKNRIVLTSDDGRAVVRLDWDGKAKKWLMTAYVPDVEGSAANIGRTGGDVRADSAPPAEPVAEPQKNSTTVMQHRDHPHAVSADPRPAEVDIEDAVKAQSEPKRSNRDEQQPGNENGVPRGLPAEQTADSDRLERGINRWRDREGHPGHLRIREVRAEALPDALRHALDRFHDATGTRIVLFRNLTPEVDDFNGVTFGDGTAYVNENNQYPVTLTAAHEWLHNLRKSNPDLYWELADEVARQGDLSGYQQRLKREKEPRWHDMDIVAEELTAAAVSDALTDPAFLQRLAERNRGLFRRVARAFLDFLNTLTQGWRDQGSNQYLQDVEAFRDKLAAVLDALPERGNTGSADVDAMYSRKAQTKAAYEARIDALFAGAKPQQPGVKMLDEADALTITGYESLPVMLMERHAVVRGSEVHPLTAEQWKQVPEWIDNPAAMFERQRDGHLTLIGPEKIGGKAVVIALKPEGMGTGGRGGKDAHLALTAYAKDTGTMPLRAMVERGDMKPLYIDQKKASSFYAGSGVQFPGSGVELRGFNKSLKTERDLVKYRAERDEAMFSRKSTVALTPEQEAFMAKAGLAADMRSTWQKARDWVAERVPDMTRMKERAAQWGLDRYYGLKDAVNKTGNIDLENDPYVAARMLNIASTMEAVLRFGAPRLKDGVLEIDRSIPGLLDALAPVKDNLNGFLGWMVARRAQLLKSQGRENLMSDADIAAGLSLRDGNEAAFDQAARDYLRLKNAILDLAEQTGTVNPQMRAMWDHAEYIPFYREGDYGAGTKKGLENQTAGIKQLKGGEAALRDPLANIMQNFTRLIDSGMKNRAMLLAVDQLGDAYFTKLSPSVGKVLVPANEVRQHLLNNGVSQAAIDAMPRAALNGMARMLAMTAPTGDNVVRVMRDGKPEYYEVADPLVLRSITAMEELQMHGVIKVMGWFKRVLTAGATMDPSFLARNLMRDTGEAAATARERFIPMYDTLRGAAESLKESELAQDLMMAGSYFRDGVFHQGDFDATQRATRRALQKHGVPESMIDKVVHTLINPKRVWDMYRALTESTEMGSRISLARNRLNAGGSKLEAAFEAKDFLDFGLHGDGVVLQWAIRTLPFLNARLQGNYRLFRMATGKERRKMVAARLASIALFTAVLYFWNMTEYEEEWENLNGWDKDMYWHIKPGTRFHIRIPKPFEIGLFAGTAVERSLAALMYQVSDGKRGDHPKQTLKAAWRGASDTLALNPVPQMARPMVEQFFNYNIFMGRNIESAFEQHKVPSERKTPRSSETAILLSKAMAGDDGDGGISPKRIEHLVRGYFGSMGMYVLRTADALVRAATDAPERPATRLRDMPAIGALYRGDGMDANTRWTGDFYELRDQARKQSGRVKTLLEEGDHEAAARIERKYAWLLGRRERSTRAKAGFMHAGVRELNRQGTKLADMRKREAEIYASRTMNGDEKNAELEQLYRERNKLTRAATQSARMREREQMRQ